MSIEEIAHPFELRLEARDPGDQLTMADLNSLIAEAMVEEGQGEEIAKEVMVKDQRPFPVGGVEIFLIWFGKAVAFEIFKRRVLPKIEDRFIVWWNKKPEADSGSRPNSGDNTKKD